MSLRKWKKEIAAIKDYISEHSDKYNKLVVIGESICNDLPHILEEYVCLDLAVGTVRDEDATDDEGLIELFMTVAEITNGQFSLIMINHPLLSDATIKEIEKGEIIYDSSF